MRVCNLLLNGSVRALQLLVLRYKLVGSLSILQQTGFGFDFSGFRGLGGGRYKNPREARVVKKMREKCA